jgi:choline dehydrogenase-like flavoprotein
VFVLAMGAIENARLLMANGLDADNAFLGSCFSDHTGRTVAEVVLPKALRFFHHQAPELDDAAVIPHVSLADSVLLENECLNFGALLSPDVRMTDVATSVANLLSAQRGRAMDVFTLLLRVENSPNPESRMALLDERDAFGMPRVRLEWRPNPLDYRSLLRAGRLLADRLVASNVGRVRPRDLTVEGLLTQATYQSHHMGTTRMAADPEAGVVDAELKMHAFSNLYVAGSSVFPSFGFANPTLTIVALSARLAGHLRSL